MSTSRAILRSNMRGKVMSHRMHPRINLETEEGFRDTMKNLTDYLVKLTEKLKEDGVVEDYSHIQELWIGKAWDAYFEQCKRMEKLNL